MQDSPIAASSTSARAAELMLLAAPEGFARPDKAWATTLSIVDEATQTPLAVLIPTKSPEEGYAVKNRPTQA
eukprot:6643220-Heterocapsa_arctica.AAC.1